MYDTTAIEEAMNDVAACRYGGIEIGLEKVRANGATSIRNWLDEYGLDLYLVMSEWVTDEAAVDRITSDIEMAAETGAEGFGILPPQRHWYDDDTVAQWLGTIADATASAGMTPLVHHHGATAVEQPSEIQRYLDSSDDLQLLFDTAHYFPYGEHYPDGDVTDGIERFADDIGYVHLKDIAPASTFSENRDALTEGNFHLDNILNYFRSFTDLGEGVIDFSAVESSLRSHGYDGHYTIEVEDQTEQPLVHAKQNIDHWRTVTE
ncbi:sugar phosphate isomerase/epimerase family protein [Halomarina halobia]|uniref:Sugar phosphate isomerase/epimerase family protein n=2 Tax=Halomarina halobia TaxID=3033386 RepID=A0ABD6ACS9_9EURY|nr:TIM barrel protein [Halomarina sp. PSR21]